MPHYPINTILPNNHTLIYATLPYQYHTAQQPYPHLYHTTLSIPDCPTTIPPSMPHYPIDTILPNNHTLIYTTLPYQYQTAQQPYPYLCHTTLSIPDCPTTIPPSIPHYPINTRLPNNHTLIYATLHYQYQTAEQPYPIYATLPYQYQTAQQPHPHLCHTTLSIPYCPTTIPPPPIYATLPYQYQTAQQPYPHLCHTNLSIQDCPITIPSSMPHYPINTRLPNNYTPIYATLPYQYQTAQQPYPHLCHTTLSIPDCPITIPHLCHTTLSIPDCPTTIPSSMPHYPINTRLPNNHTPSMPHYPINTRLPNNHTPSMPHYPINTRLTNNHTLIYTTLPYQYQTAQQPYPHLCHTTLSIPD